MDFSKLTAEQLAELLEKYPYAAHKQAEDWYRNVWLNMTEEEQKEYVREL